MDASKITAFNSAEQQLASSVQQTLEDQQGLASALSTLQEAQEVADSKQQAINTDLTAMQGQFDALVAAAIGLGLQVNLPSPSGTVLTNVNAPPADPAADHAGDQEPATDATVPDSSSGGDEPAEDAAA